jgi:hypothetical protein
LKKVEKYTTFLKDSHKWPGTVRQQRSVLIKFLKTSVQFRRRVLAYHYRAHIYLNRPGQFRPPDEVWDPAYVPEVEDSKTKPPSIFEVLSLEESMVFTMDGWRDFGVMELARLRSEENCWSFERGKWARLTPYWELPGRTKEKLSEDLLAVHLRIHQRYGPGFRRLWLYRNNFDIEYCKGG